MRLLLGAIIMLLFKKIWRFSLMAPDKLPMTLEKAEFIEKKAEEEARYVLESYDVAKAEGKNVLQWLFAAVIGGLGLTGTLVQNGYYSVAVGAFVASVCAAIATCRLIDYLHSSNIVPPGNSALSLKTIAHLPFPQMRVLEAEGIDEANTTNRKIVEHVTAGIDEARKAIPSIPWWFLGATLVTSLVRATISYFAADSVVIEFLRKFLL